MLGAPVSGLTVQTLVGLNLVQGIPGEYPSATKNLFVDYNGAAFVAPTGGKSDALTPGKGFIWYLFTSGGPDASDPNGESTRQPLPITLTASGSITGNVTTTFTAASRSGTDDGFYMLANPFPVSFDVSSISVSNGTLGTLFQIYDPEISNYRDLTATADGTNSTADDAAAWQGFFGQVTGGSAVVDKTFTYATSGVRGGAPLFYGKGGSADEVAHVLRFHLNGLTAQNVVTYDEMARVHFADDATFEWDRHDASKLYPLTSTYAVIAPVGQSFRAGEMQEKAQESLPLALKGVQVVPFSFSATTAGTYTLTWPTVEGLPSTWGLTLTDKATGTVTDLRQTAQYRFTSDAASEQQRFVLTINPGSVTSADAPDATASGLVLRPFANPLRSATHLRVEVAAQGPLTVQVVDLLGRIVATLHDGPAVPGRVALAFDPAGLPAGLYVVRAVAAGATVSRTFVVAR